MTNLPQGWEVKKLEEIANIKGGKRLPKGENLLDNNTKFAYIRVADFQDNGTINLQNIKFINENTYNVLKNYKIYDDNLYVSIAGTIGKSGIIPKELNGAILTENAVKLEYIQNNISNKFMYFFTLSSSFKTQIQTSTKIVAQPKLAITRLKQIEIPLPPLKEQERIVGILDESFAKIDESIKILEQDLLNLDELMQSALQKAFNPLKDNAKENYKLPQGWEWKSLEEISENISAGGDKPKNCTESKTAKNQIPVYANGVNNNGLVGYTDKATIIKPSLTISARGTIGFVCIRKEPYFPIVRLISLIPYENILCLHYLYFCLNFFIAKGEGSSIPQLTIPKFKSLQIPLPPLKEQEQITSHLDELSSHVKNLKQNYQAQIKDLQELKNSLLDKAFKGNL
ncbi:restriction endonuclease subunit S [Campylobacter coli]|uniref:restriction endonuclease subunit S n=1 Tax=Campylobacter coli TaxID=195 RepID=UPI001BFF9698|nr:restriction endonuclease subunit S [Campylobacter coli]MCE7086657.1 restriction endonuclease subunit S [Campylobacter coli]MCE7092061.1 restriction endonuclease subunit S [Campylobacter coli]MCE7103445.1 restriction endonuclease subunit S [Campylobacter coli]MCE7135124.1 restriction endonuclease subunit S [Campylobacter coli]MCE7157830.1 restriction endonuclease subunit S [Campylobacter coli]